MLKHQSKIVRALSLMLILSVVAFLLVGNAIPAQAPGVDESGVIIDKRRETETEMEMDLKTEIETETRLRRPQIETEYEEIIIGVAQEYGIPSTLIKAIIKTESDFNALAVSETDDYGLMQINACNISWLEDKLGITDLFDPAQNIESGAYILSGYLNRYSLADALIAYNCGESGAKRLWRQGIHSTSYTKKVFKNLDYYGGLDE